MPSFGIMSYGSSRWVAFGLSFLVLLYFHVVHLIFHNCLAVFYILICLVCFVEDPTEALLFNWSWTSSCAICDRIPYTLSCYFLLGFWVFIAFIIWFILCFESLIFWIYTCFVKSCSSILSTIHSSPFIWLNCFLILGLFICLNLLFFAPLVPF